MVTVSSFTIEIKRNNYQLTTNYHTTIIITSIVIVNLFDESNYSQ